MRCVECRQWTGHTLICSYSALDADEVVDELQSERDLAIQRALDAELREEFLKQWARAKIEQCHKDEQKFGAKAIAIEAARERITLQAVLEQLAAPASSVLLAIEKAHEALTEYIPYPLEYSALNVGTELMVERAKAALTLLAPLVPRK